MIPDRSDKRYILKFREPGKRPGTVRWGRRPVATVQEAVDWMNDNQDKAFLPGIGGDERMDAGHSGHPLMSAKQEAIVRLFPTPWSVDVSPQDTSPARRMARIYAADSTPVCWTKGEHAAGLAELITQSVNGNVEASLCSTSPQGCAKHG